MEKRNKLFRRENLNRLSSPEDLNDFLKVVNPSSWVILSSVFLILAGMFVWSLVGTLEKKITASAEVSNGVAHFIIKDNVIKSGMPVKIADTESSMQNVGINKNGNYIASANVPEMADGIYEAKITIEYITPIKFLFN